MDMSGLAEVLKLVQTMGPGLAMGVLGIWFAMKKDAQYTALMERLVAIAEKNTASNIQVVGSLDGLREAIRIGTRQ